MTKGGSGEKKRGIGERKEDKKKGNKKCDDNDNGIKKNYLLEKRESCMKTNPPPLRGYLLGTASYIG